MCKWANFRYLAIKAVVILNNELIQELKKLNENLETINDTLHEIDCDLDNIYTSI